MRPVPLSLKITLAEWRTAGGDYLLVYRDADSGKDEVVAGANRVGIRGPGDLENVRADLFRKAFELERSEGLWDGNVTAKQKGL